MGHGEQERRWERASIQTAPSYGHDTTKQSLLKDESEILGLYLVTAPTGEARCWLPGMAAEAMPSCHYRISTHTMAL